LEGVLILSEIRKDLVRDNWVVIATDRAVKPSNLPVPALGSAKKAAGFCPFCEGNEKFTPPEILALRPSDLPSNDTGWSVRVVPNKFSAYGMDTPLIRESVDMYTRQSGFGSHEVVIESPEHDQELHFQPLEKIASVIGVLRDRYLQIAGDERFKFIQIYKNRGLFAGASLSHSHCQIISLPYVPDQFKGAVNYASENSRCLFCDMIELEIRKKERLILETDNFVVVCPYAPRFTYETWILPKNHQENFGELDDSKSLELSQALKKLLVSIVDTLDDPSYNLVVHTAPVNVPHVPGYHWFIEVSPRLIVQSGVEVATGYFMNPISPEWAAETLRKNILNRKD
jgi:UDPglucose--hexose-1-phosphate uridylyltransferase